MRCPEGREIAELDHSSRCQTNARFEEYDVMTGGGLGIKVMLRSFESSLLFDTSSGAQVQRSLRIRDAKLQ